MPLANSVEVVMLNDRENILSALREKALRVREIMRRANVMNEQVCQSLLLKMRDEGVVKFDIHSGRWLIGGSAGRNESRALSLMSPLSVNSGTAKQNDRPKAVSGLRTSQS